MKLKNEFLYDLRLSFKTLQVIPPNYLDPLTPLIWHWRKVTTILRLISSPYLLETWVIHAIKVCDSINPIYFFEIRITSSSLSISFWNFISVASFELNANPNVCSCFAIVGKIWLAIWYKSTSECGRGDRGWVLSCSFCFYFTCAVVVCSLMSSVPLF